MRISSHGSQICLGYAAQQAKGLLTPYSFERREPRDYGRCDRYSILWDLSYWFVQKSSGSLTTVLPKHYCQELGIEKNDLLVLSLNGKQIIVEKGFVTPESGYQE